MIKKILSLLKPDKTARLFKAVESGKIEVVEKLIEEGQNLNITSAAIEWPLLLSAVPHPEILSLLLTKGANPDCQEKNKWYSPLINAARLNRIESVKLLLAHHADRHLTSFAGLSALVYAIERDNETIAKMLIDEEDNSQFLTDVIDTCVEKNIPLSNYKEMIEKRLVEIEDSFEST